MSEFSDWLQNNWIDLARLGVQIAILTAIVRYGRRVLGALRVSQEQIGALLRLSVAEGVSEAREQHVEREPAPLVGREPFAEPGLRKETVSTWESGPRIAIAEPAFDPSVLRETTAQRIWEPETVAEPAFAGPASMLGVDYGERSQSLGGRVLGGGLSAATAVLDAPIAHNEPIEHGEQPVPRSEVRPFTPWVSAPTTDPEVSSGLPAGAVAQKQAGGVQSWLNAPIKRSSGPGPMKRMVRWLKTPVRTHARPAR